MKIVQTIQGGEAVMLTDHQRAMADLELQHKSAIATLQRKYDQLYESWRLLQERPALYKMLQEQYVLEQSLIDKAPLESRRYTGINGDVLEGRTPWYSGWRKCRICKGRGLL